MSGSGISWTICKSAPRSRQITTPAPTTQFFTGRMPFLPPNQQRQSTEDIFPFRCNSIQNRHNSDETSSTRKHDGRVSQRERERERDVAGLAYARFVDCSPDCASVRRSIDGTMKALCFRCVRTSVRACGRRRTLSCPESAGVSVFSWNIRHVRKGMRFPAVTLNDQDR